MAEEKSRAVYAEFHRKPVDGQELTYPIFPGEKWKVQTEKVVELSQEDFNMFVDELDGHYEFLSENSGFMYFDDGEHCAHSLLVTTPKRREGILVQSEGFPYVRYGAYIQDCSVLELSEIPWESRVPGGQDSERDSGDRAGKGDGK